ncbi:MAG TPA: Gfo/Idh/MocA family oxidoreductase [Candidatus Hydrogenedentes bacterium]|nr:Gfo/Idh/MocA family oxidoreductase [Candidatus Hydrogenedentota bacterium]HNT88276.1 Gfo/Idh/MocA family oxidoreductase [Candidatus Hydrogenedentota bacterium]
MNGLSRRQFLGASAAAVTAACVRSRHSVFGANDRVGVCVVGVNGRGQSHMSGFTDSAMSEVVALCDPDERVLDERAKQLAAKTGKTPKKYVDIRDALADETVHAIGIATPNHWHSLATIWACQAGKDVYVEKPLSHNVWEGRQVVAAAKKYGRIVQHGTQRRSESNWMRDIALLQSGEIIGPVYMARALCYKRRDGLPAAADQDPPAHLHWRLWQGPAAEKPYNPLYVHYNWHWFWHYGNGDIGNQGVHQMDVAAWGMNKGLPVKIQSAGGRYTYNDPCETPNTQVATFTYADGTMTAFEVRGRWTNKEEGVGVGNLFYADRGYYVEGKGFFNEKGESITVDAAKYPEPKSMGPYDNFLRAVHERDESLIRGTALDGHVASAHCHLANVAYRLSRTIEFDPETETCPGDAEANALLTREYHAEFEAPALA